MPMLVLAALGLRGEEPLDPDSPEPGKKLIFNGLDTRILCDA